jgi:hypothetical protein
MAYFLFIDESGQDRVESPYEVLAGVAIRDCDLWNVIIAIRDAEIRNFGRRYSAGTDELKAKKILKKKVFKHANRDVEILPDEIVGHAKKALDYGVAATPKHLKGLALAKLKYVTELFEICTRFRCKVFASIVDRDAEPTASVDALRKDYAYLFERFFYYLEDQAPQEQGIIVFDELEKSQSHILIDQAHRYFSDLTVGRQRAGLIIPEPFFVHSELTTGVQLADLVAYIVSWGYRLPTMKLPARAELAGYGQQISALRYRAVREVEGVPNFVIWSFAYITDLRTRSEKSG